MMLYIIAVAAGILLGIFSGLVPGIHSNTVASVLSMLPISPEAFPYIIAAVLGAHLVFQFLPAIFLSIPDSSVVVSVLPGHRMALEGRGRQAITICAFSVMLAAVSSAILLPVSLVLLPALYSVIQPNMALVLIAASLFLVASERELKKIGFALFVFLLAGALGIASMRGAIVQPLFPAFSGLFAASGILLSFTMKRKMPKQKKETAKLDFLPYVAAGLVLGMLSDLLPGIAAPAQIAVFASVLVSTKEARKFLALVASIAASHCIFAFAAMISIGKAREGSLAIMQQINPVFLPDLPVLIGILLVSIGVCAFLLTKIAKHAGKLQEIDMNAINLLILAYLVLAVAIISGGTGLLLFATATAVGVIPPLLGIRRTHVMGLIIVPSILLYL